MPTFRPLEDVAAEAREHKGRWYVMTPYSAYPFGRYAAFCHAAKITGELAKAGVKVMSPIAHSHPVALYGSIDPTDHEFWLDFDQDFLDWSVGGILVNMRGWDTSYGVGCERRYYDLTRKPVLCLDVGEMFCKACGEGLRLLDFNGRFYHERDGNLFECEAA